jgi:hypothetical protein
MQECKNHDASPLSYSLISGGFVDALFSLASPSPSFRFSSDPDTNPSPSCTFLPPSFQVDLTLHGHHHTYQRTCPMYNGTCLGFDERTGHAMGPVHLVIGNGGASLSLNVADPPPEYLEVRLWSRCIWPGLGLRRGWG